MIAGTLDAINAQRRAVQRQMTFDAEAVLAQLQLAGDGLPPAVCLFDPQWHPGVVGLVASKVKERLHRPAIAFAPAEPGSPQLRGSARSIPGLHIRDVLAAVDTIHPGLIVKFGGHAMAAGLTLDLASLPQFREALREQVARLLDPALLSADVASDGELPAHEFTRQHAQILRDGGPWGQGYPEPQFDGVFQVMQWRVVGERHLKLELGLAQPGSAVLRLNAIEFGGWSGEPPSARVRIVYRLEPDDYRGGDAIQLVVVHREVA